MLPENPAVYRYGHVMISLLDRLGRTLKNLIEPVERLDSAKVGLSARKENIDTRSNGGKLVFHLFGALAEFERNLIRDKRTTPEKLVSDKRR